VEQRPIKAAPALGIDVLDDGVMRQPGISAPCAKALVAAMVTCDDEKPSNRHG